MQTCNLNFLLLTLTYDKANFRFIFIYVYMNEYHLVQVCVCVRGQNWVLDALELELQAVVTCPVWVQRTKFESLEEQQRF